MVSTLFLGFSLLQIGFWLLTFQLLRQHRQPVYLFILLALTGLVYDNLIVGLGAFIGSGSLLQQLNFIRYALHALLTPLLIMAGLYLARYAFVGWAWGKKTTALFVAMTVLMILVGVWTDIWRLELETAVVDGVVRYVNAAAIGPPLPAIVTLVSLIVCGTAIQARQRWPWLLIGAAIMFLTAAIPNILLTNLGEVVLAAGLVFTARRFPPLPANQATAALPSAAEQTA